MSIQSKPSPSLPPESGPASLPSEPGGALWSDSDAGAQAAHPAAFSAGRQSKEDAPLITIGHIGRYALKYRIAEGGLGAVYAAHDPLLSRLIAIKTLSVDIAESKRAEFNAMFLNEARAAASLSHPHIVTVFDAGVSERKAYIAMELLKGRDLRQLRKDGWRPTPPQAALIVRRVADALAYAHSKGVVHRDVKPANIFMVGRTQPRVLDFGIAHVTHQHDIQAGEQIAGGTPYYMSPEQVRHQPADRRTDVFSLGVVLYELLTDTKPFRGSSLAKITASVLENTPLRANIVNPDVPKVLADIAARAMEKDPANRFRSARALSRELRHWLNTQGTAAEGKKMLTKGPDRRRVWWSAAAGGGLALAALVGWALTSHQPTTEMAAQQSVDVPFSTPQPVVVRPSFEEAPKVAIAASAVVVPADASVAAFSSSTVAAAPVAAASAAPAIVTTGMPAASADPLTATTSAAPAAAASEGSAVSRTPIPDIKDTPLAKVAPREFKRQARVREVGDHAATAGLPIAKGIVRLAVQPWGQVEIDGVAIGTTPPLTAVTLLEGKHQIAIRNADFPPYITTVTVIPGKPVVLKATFGR